MPKHSSKSDQSITPSGEFMRLYRRRWVGLILMLVAVIIAVVVFMKPKSLQVTSAVPSGAIAYARVDRILDQMKSLRASKFWAGISQVNVPDLLMHEGIAQDKVSRYIQWRDRVHGILSHPAFKQFFGREAAVALYPPMEGFSNGSWPLSFSGMLLIARPESGTRITEAIASAWNLGAKEWKSSQAKYKNITITSVVVNGEYPTIYYVRLDDLIFFSLDERLLHRVVDVSKNRTGVMNQEEQFQKTSKRFYASSGGEFFMDVPLAKEFLKQNIGLIEDVNSQESANSLLAQLQKALSITNGVYNVSGSFLAGQPLRAKWLLSFDPDQSVGDLNRLNNCIYQKNPLMAMIPKEVILYQWMGCLDFVAQYQQLKTYRQSTSKGINDQDDPVADLQKMWGLNFEQDILPILGDEIGWFVQGVDTGGFFPVPKLAVFLKVKDVARAEEILKKIVSTPVTMLQSETYANTKINFVTVPLIQAFKPSFAFVQDYLFMATSDKLIKQGLDASSDPTVGLIANPVFKLHNQAADPKDELIIFMNLGEIARQCKTLLDWADEWFARKIGQIQADSLKINQELELLTQDIDKKSQQLNDRRNQIDTLRQEIVSIESQVKASSVVLEAQNTLAQEGVIQQATVNDSERPEKMLEIKKSQEAAIELEAESLRQEIDLKTASRPDLMNDLKDYELQKTDAQKYRFYINQIVVPVVYGLEALSAQTLTTNVQDGVLESELFISAQ